MLRFLDEGEDVGNVLVVNKTDGQVTVPISGVRGAQARLVDQASGGGPIRTERVTGDQFTLVGYGVAIVTRRN